MVSEEYRQRLAEWMRGEVVRHGGMAPYSRHTMKILPKYGFSGFHPGQIQRYTVPGRIKQPLLGRSLARIGILKGLSTDPDEAARLTRAWLEGTPAPSAPAPLSTTPPTWAGPQTIPYDLLQPEELATIVAEAGSRLDYLLNQQQAQTPRPTALSNLLMGMQMQEKLTLAETAAHLGTSPARAKELLEGYPPTASELDAIGRWAKLPVMVLEEMGKSAEARSEQIERVDVPD